MVQNGLKAIGYDRSQERVDLLNSGVSPVEDVSDAELKEALADGLIITADEQDLADSDAVFICVPSPLGRNREPDLSFIKSAAATVAAVVKT